MRDPSFYQDILRNPLILVVEDDPGAAGLAKAALLRMGYQATLAGDGDTAFSLALEDRPAAILLDLRIPPTDGFTLCKQLKGHKDTCDIPIIVLSAHHSRDSVVKALEAGASDFLAKPLDPQVLMHKLGALLPEPLVQPEGDLESDDRDNRREYVRINQEAEGILHMALQVVDISEGGVGILGTSPAEAGSAMQLRSPLLEEVFAIPEVMIRIKYCRYAQAQGRYRMGAEFIGLGEKERKQIRQFIYRRQMARVKTKGG